MVHKDYYLYYILLYLFSDIFVILHLKMSLAITPDHFIRLYIFYLFFSRLNVSAMNIYYRVDSVIGRMLDLS